MTEAKSFHVDVRLIVMEEEQADFMFTVFSDRIIHVYIIHCRSSELLLKIYKFIQKCSTISTKKRLFNVIKEWDTTWIPCDSLHAWL